MSEPETGCGAGCECGCCEGLGQETPRTVFNRPGLPVVSYRTGRYGDFRESMLARLSSTDFPAISSLTVRDDADFSIALCDATSVMLDVLSFYQERLVNESFLRTAVDRRSVMELARLIGYQAAPGVAASTWLAFSLQEAPGLPGQAPVVAPVPSGTRAQSIPGPGEDPQTFETTAAIEARAGWNALTVQTATAWRPERDDTDVYLAGVSTGLAVGDAVLIVGQERQNDPGSERWDVRIIAGVEADAAYGHTRVRWLDGLGSHMPSMLPSQDSPRVYVLRQRAAFFGHNAPDPRLMNQRETRLAEMTNNGVTWKNYEVSANRIDLDAAYPRIIANSWLVLVSNEAGMGSPSLPGYTELFRAKAVSAVARVDFGMSARITRIVPEGEHLDAEHYGIASTLVLAQSEELPVAPRPLMFPLFGAAITLGSLQSALVPGQALALSGQRQRLRVADGVHGLIMTVTGGNAAGITVELSPGDSLQMEGVPLRRVGAAVFPMTPEEFGDALRHQVLLRLTLRDRDGAVGTVDLSSRQVLLQPALGKDEALTEVVFIDDADASVEHRRDATVLSLASGTQHVYDRRSARINANVAPATHGETVVETLGGSTGAPDQRVALRQYPVTQVSATTPSGRASSLELRVNDLLWKEVRSLYGATSTDRLYETRIDDAGRTTVYFGDGVEGARPPSGQDNIRARYRKGLGAGGNVAAGQVANLLTRPLGVSGVSNPEPARGGQDAEHTDAARENAPLTVRTLDRAVSLQDYEDFSRSFAGIAKAHATWIAAGPGRGVFVTVAGDAGDAVSSTGPTFSNLVASLRRYGDGQVPLRLASYQRAELRLRVAVKVSPDCEVGLVLTRAEVTLRQAFSFAARQFGQAVSVDEVAAVLHDVDGVQAVNVIEMYRVDAGGPPRLDPRVFARVPETSLNALPQPAELLVLEAGPLRIEVMA